MAITTITAMPMSSGTPTTATTAPTTAPTLGISLVDGAASEGDWVDESVDLVMTVLAAMEVVGGIPVTSSAQLLLVGPVHERNEQNGIV